VVGLGRGLEVVLHALHVLLKLGFGRLFLVPKMIAAVVRSIQRQVTTAEAFLMCLGC